MEYQPFLSKDFSIDRRGGVGTHYLNWNIGSNKSLFEYFKNLLDANKESDVRFFENGWVAISGSFYEDMEAILILNSLTKSSVLFVKRNGEIRKDNLSYEETLDFFEIDSKFPCPLNKDDYPAALEAYTCDLFDY